MRNTSRLVNPRASRASPRSGESGRGPGGFGITRGRPAAPNPNQRSRCSFPSPFAAFSAEASRHSIHPNVCDYPATGRDSASWPRRLACPCLPVTSPSALLATLDGRAAALDYIGTAASLRPFSRAYLLKVLDRRCSAGGLARWRGRALRSAKVSGVKSRYRRGPDGASLLRTSVPP